MGLAWLCTNYPGPLPVWDRSSGFVPKRAHLAQHAGVQRHCSGLSEGSYTLRRKAYGLCLISDPRWLALGRIVFEVPLLAYRSSLFARYLTTPERFVIPTKGRQGSRQALSLRLLGRFSPRGGICRSLFAAGILRSQSVYLEDWTERQSRLAQLPTAFRMKLDFAPRLNLVGH